MTAFDHVVALLLVVVFPPLTASDMPRLARRLEADPIHARTSHYLWNVAILGGLTTAVVVGMSWLGRPLADAAISAAVDCRSSSARV